MEKLIEQRNNSVLYSSSAALCLITAFDNNPVLNSEFLDGGPVFFHLSEIKHGGGLCQRKQRQLPLSLAEHRQQHGRTLALGPANKPRLMPGASRVSASSYCISAAAITWKILHGHHPIGVLHPRLPKAACPAGSGLAAWFITPSSSAFGVAGEGGGFKCLRICPQLLQISPELLPSEAKYLSHWRAAVFVDILKRQDGCSSRFRFPLLIEISCLPENNCCQWQLLQLKCLLMVCNAQTKPGIMCQVMNELN